MMHTRESVLEALRSAKGASLGRKIDTLGRAAREAFCKAPARGEEFSIALLADRPIYEAELDAVVDALNAAGTPATKATVPCPRCAGGTPCEVCGGKGRLPRAGAPRARAGVCSDLCIKTRGYGMQLYCTLAAGHEGDHVGHSGAGNALGTWPQAAPARERDWRVPPPLASCELTYGSTWHCAYLREDVPVQWRGVRGEGATQADAYADFCARIRRGYASSGKGVARCAHDGGDLVSIKGVVCVLCGATGMRLPDLAEAKAAPWTGELVADALRKAGPPDGHLDAVRASITTLWGRLALEAWEGAGYSESVHCLVGVPYYVTRFDALADYLNGPNAVHRVSARRADAPPTPEPPPKVDRYLAARIDRLKKAGDLGSSVLTTVEAATAACRDRLAVVRRGAVQARETAAHYEAMEREIVAALAECGAKDGAS